jgi:hypothetical protein
MEILNNWFQFIAVIITLVLGFIGVGKYMKKIATRDLSAHIERQSALCTSHKGEIATIKATTRMMLQCHDVTLQALDNLSHGRQINGEIAQQRKDLKAHMLDRFSKEI